MVFSEKGLWHGGMLLILAALLINGCKEPELVGLDVLPGGQQLPIAWVDTFTLKARTVTDDSVNTSTLSSYLIGDFGDPTFGRLRSELFTQVALPSAGVDFGANATVDSVILHLTYSGSYGYTDKLRGTMRFGVYRITEDLQNESIYRSNAQPQAVDPTPLASIEFRPDLVTQFDLGDYTVVENVDPEPNDTVPVLLPPALRIALDPAFGQQILDLDTINHADIFLDEFKGINIRSESAAMPSGFGSILYFNLNPFYSGLELHYSNDSEVGLQFDFDLVQEYATHTLFDHDFPIDINHALADTTVAGDTRLYVRSMAGLKMKVEFPYLRELNELGHVAINKAELVVPLDESVDFEHAVPYGLAISGIDSSGISINIVDHTEGISYYGGLYDAGNQEYVFNVARHLQDVLNSPEKQDNGLYLLNLGNSVNARRGVFNGPKHPDKPMKLRMTFTIIE